MPSFWKALKSLSGEDQEAVRTAIPKFIDRSAENALRPEPKKGISCWAFRANDSIRVFWRVVDRPEGTVNSLFHVGRHDDYRRVKRK